MGLFQKAYETYENHRSLVGSYSAGGKVFDEPLAPVGHIITKAELEITLTAEGNFVSVDRVEKGDAKTIIPVTEESAGRTSGICAHPLCDNLGYLSPDNREKNALYVAQLSEWENSEYTHPILTAVLNYIKRGTIADDLKNASVEYSEKGIVRWSVIGLDEGENRCCYKNESLFGAFERYYLSKKKENVLCMISGKYSPKASQHIKGVSALNGNAKLVSANDTTNFTFRGRFGDESEAATMSYEASQKSHNALKWLIANQADYIGKRAFLCWNPSGKAVPKPHLPFRRVESAETVPSDYGKDLFLALNGYKYNFEPSDSAVIAVFDAATSGRLALTYYSEVRISDYEERLKAWDETCAWKYRKTSEVSIPSLREIVRCAFGVERNGKLDVDERLEKEQMQRLLRCRLDASPMPWDIVFAISEKAKHPSSYNKKTYENLQYTACAVIRKYYIDHFKEEYKMALERDKRDRSYQYGRLLAILDKAERDTYENTEDRETNAMRLQTAFCEHPLRSSKQLIEQVKTGYYPRLVPNRRAFYERQIGEIMEILSSMPEAQLNAPLKETYILGYYLQKNELYSKKDTNEKSEGNENE